MIGKKINQLATELAPVSTDLTIIGDPDSGVSKKITLAQLGAIFSGAVSFYTNLASFPAVGDINVIYCAKDTQKLYLWSGSAYVEVFPSQALLDTYQLRSEKGVSNGYASLDSGGKVPISQLPSSIMEYKGTWNASTNTPTLANGTGDTGDVYICNVAGTVNFGAGPITFAVGDYTIYSGSIWQRSSGAVGTVTSVAVSRSGDALAITGSPVTTSGTINIGFAGNSTQYINGAGNLVTFPGVINEAQNLITEVYNKTGATLTKGTVVYINGGQGNLPTITKALASADATSAQTYGIVRNDITNNNNGYVVVAGRISDLDTQAYTEGTQLYLSSTTAGTYTSTKQYAPNHLVYVGVVVRAHPTQGVVEVKIQNGYELDELHNVAAQTPSNNDGLFWEASTSLWKNKSLSTILGGTPITGSGNVNAIPKFTANSVLGNSVMEDDGNFVSMRGLKINAVAGVGNTINFQQGSGITAAGLGYSTIGAASTTGFVFYIDQNTTSRSFILDTSTITSATQLTYSLPASSGTLALVSQLTGGTVTSVGLSSATSGVTIGSTPITTSGTITLAIATASGSQQGLLSSTDWTTFNNKQNALTNPVTGTGTTNYLSKFTGASTIGNSLVYDSGTGIVIGGAVTTNGFLEIIKSGSSIAQFSFGQSTTYRTDFFVDATGNFYIQPQGTTRLTLSASGNLGLGVTPSAWASGYKVAQYQGGFLGSDGTSYIYFGQNAYSDGTFKYLANGLATIYAQDAGKYIWYQAPSGTAGNAISFTQAMTLDASGRLGIGATSMTYALQVNDTAGGNMFRFASGSTVLDYYVSGGNPSFGTASNNDLRFRTNDTTRFTIASTGAATFSSSVAVNGTTLDINPASGQPNIALRSGNTYRGYIEGNSSGGLSFGAGASANIYQTITSAGNVGIGTTSPSVALQVDASGGGIIRATRLGAGSAYVQLEADGTNGTLTSSAALIMNAGGSERMRISSGGDICINSTSGSNGAIFNITKASGSITTITGGITTAQNHIVFANPNGNVGSIQVSGSATSYNTSSDYRLKQDLKDFNGLDLLTKIKTYDYEWKADNSRSYGVIAHELQSVINYAVTGVKDGKEMQGVDYSKIVPVLIKAIQEQQAQIEQLKNK